MKTSLSIKIGYFWHTFNPTYVLIWHIAVVCVHTQLDHESLYTLNHCMHARKSASFCISSFNITLTHLCPEPVVGRVVHWKLTGFCREAHFPSLIKHK